MPDSFCAADVTIKSLAKILLIIIASEIEIQRSFKSLVGYCSARLK